MTLDDFDYDLPPELIAQQPLPERGASRLMLVDGVSGSIRDAWFKDLPSMLRPGDLLVFNDTRVIKARLLGHKPTGGRVEVLVERILDDHEALVLMRVSHNPAPGSSLLVGDGLELEVMDREGEFFRVRFPREESVLAQLERHGRLPLPPYIERSADSSDDDRYQTVYAARPGSVAAPTAGLHFSDEMLTRIAQLGVRMAKVTLHVGAGTFQPVRVQEVRDHRMHAERYFIDEGVATAVRETRLGGGRVIAVGTTSLRALEGAAMGSGELVACSGDTNLYILPGFRFRIVDCLFTNFHLPRSTLLMLVSAFGGIETLRRAYAHAVASRYRFFSYGDCMFIDRAPMVPAGS